jgi:hypothetical protein
LRRHNTSFDEVVHLTTDVLKISARIVFSVGTDALRTRIGDLDPPAYIRLMCGRLTSRLMWPSLHFFGGTTSVPGSDQRKRPEMFVLSIVFRWSLSRETEPSYVVDGA